MSAPLRIAIATDLHYMPDKEGGFSPQVCAIGSRIDPMCGLINYLSESSSVFDPTADVLICPGDITTSACISSFNQGWGDLNNLKEKLGASHLIAATGNHEVVSRASGDHNLPGNSENSVRPFEHLIKIKNYPAEFKTIEDKWVYWGRGYQVICGDSWVVVVVNSCHYHNTLQPNEYERGRIGDAALEELRDTLKALSKSYLYRIMVLHHPPASHEEFDVELGRFPMYNGELLIKALEDTNKDWFVIHGHKHVFRLVKSTGSEYSPMIFGAASFGALLSGDIAHKTKNQFYIVELDIGEKDSGERLKGKLESIYWDGSSWSVCNKRAHGLPHGCGFDLASPVRSVVVAKEVHSAISESENKQMAWGYLKSSIYSLNYLMPKDIETLRCKLKELGVQYTWEEGEWFPQELWID